MCLLWIVAVPKSVTVCVTIVAVIHIVIILTTILSSEKNLNYPSLLPIDVVNNMERKGFV